jgi:signal transduction histidine kinase
MEDIISSRIEINRLHEQWIIVKTDAMNFLTSDKQKNIGTKLNSSLKTFEIGMDGFSESKLLRQFKRRSSEISVKSLLLILEWKDIKANLIEILSTGTDFDDFSKQIYWLANDTVGFDNDLKDFIVWFDVYNRNQFQLYWQLFYFVSVGIFIAVFFLGKYAREYLKAKHAEEESRNLIDSIVSVRENERLRVALEIHDTIIQDMVFSKMLCMDLLHSKTSAENQKFLLDLTNTIVKSISQIRDISSSLRPPELDKNIGVIVSDHCDSFVEKTGMNVDYKVVGFENAKMDKGQKLGLYRILQECLTNIRKHSEASAVTIRLLLSYPYIIFRVADNGKGVKVENIRNSSDGRLHIGIRGIEERVHMFGGAMSIKSLPEQGFKIAIKMALKETENGT